MNIGKLLLEMTVVGVGLAVLGLIITYTYELITTGEIQWYPPHFWGMVLGTIATGALFHLLCEATGVNAWYVKQYKPLLK